MLGTRWSAPSGLRSRLRTDGQSCASQRIEERAPIVIGKGEERRANREPAGISGARGDSGDVADCVKTVAPRVRFDKHGRPVAMPLRAHSMTLTAAEAGALSDMKTL